MKIFRLLMVVLRLTLVKSAKSVNLVSAGRMGDRLRSMADPIVGELAGVSTYRHIVVRLDFCFGMIGAME